MRNLLSVLFLGVCWTAVNAGNTILDDPLDYMADETKFESLPGHIVFDVRGGRSRYFLYRFSTFPNKNYIQLSSRKTWTIRWDFPDVQKLTHQVDQVTLNFTTIKSDTRKQTSVSVVVDAELKNDVTTDHFCHLLLDKFDRMGFDVTNKNCLFLDSNSKAFLVWFLINQSKDVQKTGEFKTHPVLHLSAEFAGISFAVDDDSKLVGVDPRQIFTIETCGKKRRIYSIGVSNLGLTRARMQILAEEKDGAKGSMYQSHCVHPEMKLVNTWRNVTITGRDSKCKVRSKGFGVDDDEQKVVDVDKCTGVVAKVVEKFTKPPRSSQHKFFTASNVFTALDFQISDELTESNLDRMKTEAEAECSYRKKDHPLDCMDHVYAYVLLRDYFKLDCSDEISNINWIYSEYTDWTLSVAYLNAYKRRMTENRSQNKNKPRK